MPIYEYRCTKGHTFDTMQSFSDAPVSECQVCGAPTQRVMHAPAVHFKGSGFYNTDYGTRKRSRELKEYKESTKNESSSSSSEKSGDSKSSDAKSSSASDSSSSSSSSDSSSKSSDSKRSDSGSKAKAKAE
ncbi:MAG: FmdB family zinc ribbon protein [Solirubrobacteraceae bacterium]